MTGMPRHDDLRAQADAILDNTTPTRSHDETARATRARDRSRIAAARDTARSAIRDLEARNAVAAAIENGQPKFPHAGHLAATWTTLGLWSPVYGLCWLVSKQRRYRRARRAELRRNGIDC